MIFAMQIEYEKSDFVAYAKAHDRTRNKKQRIVQRFLAGICCLLEVLMILSCVTYGEASTQMILLMILMPVLGAEMLLMPRILALTMARTNRKIGRIEMRFEEEQVSVRRDVESTIYQYGAFDSISHDKGAYYLYLNRQMALVIPERCFTQGDPAAFGAFISEKTGLEMKEIN